ncbi:MAG: glycosyltransferase family 4 protein [Saprospiraceae bacterium]|nr:glycosyltransferase family 4 protein [Saprospiraceae bacterium]
MKGGMEKHIYNLSVFQSKIHEVTIFYNQGSPLSTNDVQILPSLKVNKIKPQFLGILIFYMTLLYKLFIRHEKYDVIHIHGDWSSLVFSRLLKKITKACIIVFSYHGMIQDNKFKRHLLKSNLKKTDIIFATGYDSTVAIKNLIQKEIYFQPSGINGIFFIKSNKNIKKVNFHVVTVANLVKVKNLELVISIAQKLPDIDFSIVGKGDEEESLKKSIIKKNIKNVTLMGYKSHEEVKELYDSSDCFLLTSLAEGTPTSALEAMASGLPIITSNAGGIEHIVQTGINGFVAYDYRPETYIDYIKTLVNSPELCKKISSLNREIAKDFKWTKVAESITTKTIDCYNKKTKH